MFANWPLTKQNITVQLEGKYMTTVKHNYVIIVLIIWIFFIIQLTSCFSDFRYEYVSPTPISSRVIADITLPLHEKWRRSDVLIPFNDEAKIYALDERLFFVAYKNDGKTHWLEAIDAKSGSLLWKTQDLLFLENSLAADQGSLYLALAGKILAYNISTGNLLWETHEPLLGHTKYSVYPEADKLLVYSEEDISQKGREQIIRTYNQLDGSPLKTDNITIPHNATLLLKTDLYNYWTDGTALWSINSSNKEQWRTNIRERIQYQPVLSGDRLIFATGIFSNITALNNITGGQIWTYNEKIVSNLAVKEGILYAIKSDATLVAINTITGEEIGYIKLTPDATETDSRTKAYLVTATEEMLFVYCGDSQELIAFSK
jgi:outer membrane protein assembly factor BamB